MKIYYTSLKSFNCFLKASGATGHAAVLVTEREERERERERERDQLQKELATVEMYLKPPP